MSASKLHVYLQESGPSFCLFRRRLDIDDVEIVVKGLKENAKISRLTLSNNRLGSEGLCLLSKGLSSMNRTLVSLTLAENQIGDAGVVHLVEKSLSFIKSSLDLRKNAVEDKGAQALASALKWHQTMSSLELRGNPKITAIGADALVSMLRENGSLVHLSVDLDEFNVEAATLCQRNVEMHEKTMSSVKTLLALRLLRRATPFPKEIVSMIAYCLWETRTDIATWSVNIDSNKRRRTQ